MIEDSPESTADEKTEMPDYIKVSRTWKDIPNEAFIGRFPTEKEITRWKREFEKAHAVDSVWHGQLGLYKDAEQYICDVDFVELLHGRFCKEFPQNDRRTEWRLLQYGYDSNRQTPVTELGKVMNLKGIYEDVLDSELGSQMDMNLHSWLVNDFQDFYIRLLYDVCSKKLSSPVAQALRAEQAAAKRAHAKTSAAYRKIDGSPSGFDGSSYPYRVASFGSVALDMELNAQEAFLKAVLADSLVSSTDFVPIAQAKENAIRNGLQDRIDFLAEDVFDLLPELAAAGRKPYDLIILDPPAFTKSRKTAANAERGYHEINYRAMKLLPRGGYLATASCSHFMPAAQFETMLRSAAADAGVSLRQIEVRQQAADHPILWNVPETDYLKFYLFQVV